VVSHPARAHHRAPVDVCRVSLRPLRVGSPGPTGARPGCPARPRGATLFDVTTQLVGFLTAPPAAMISAAVWAGAAVVTGALPAAGRVRSLRRRATVLTWLVVAGLVTLTMVLLGVASTPGERRDVVRPRRPDRGAGGRRGADLGSIARRVARGHARLHARAWLADAPGTSGVVRAPAAGGSGSAGRAGGRAGCAAVRRPRRRVAFAGDAGYVGRRRRPGCRTGQRGPIRSTAHAHPPPTKCGRPAAALRSVYDLSRGRTLHPSRRRRTRPIRRG
jgi:hypothetical protein